MIDKENTVEVLVQDSKQEPYNVEVLVQHGVVEEEKGEVMVQCEKVEEGVKYDENVDLPPDTESSSFIEALFTAEGVDRIKEARACRKGVLAYLKEVGQSSPHEIISAIDGFTYQEIEDTLCLLEHQELVKNTWDDWTNANEGEPFICRTRLVN